MSNLTVFYKGKMRSISDLLRLPELGHGVNRQILRHRLFVAEWDVKRAIRVSVYSAATCGKMGGRARIAHPRYRCLSNSK